MMQAIPSEGKRDKLYGATLTCLHKQKHAEIFRASSRRCLSHVVLGFCAPDFIRALDIIVAYSTEYQTEPPQLDFTLCLQTINVMLLGPIRADKLF